MLPEDTAVSRPPNARRKAAMILQLVLSEGRRLPLDRLPEEVQVALTREITALNLVDRDTLDSVAQEFLSQLDAVAMSAPDGMDEVLNRLDGQLSPGAAARLKEEAERLSGADPWPRVLALTPEQLKPIMESESIEVCAVLLSKLPVARAAEVVGLVSGERARCVSHAVSRTRNIGPTAVRRIGESLAVAYGRPPQPAFSSGPGARVGAILNSSRPATREEVLKGLDEDDPEFAEEVRRAIFTFDDMPERMRPQDVPKIPRIVDQADLVTALAGGLSQGGASLQAAEFLLQNLSQRMAGALREEIADRGRVKRADAEAASMRLITAIREAADAGEIVLRSEGDEEEED